jgi:hypothetical protein
MSMHGEFRFTVICNLERKEFFFSTDHIQRYRSTIGSDLDEHWVPVSGVLPMQVTPRPSLPDGIIETIEEYIMIFHDDEKEIANPDPKFQPSYRPAPSHNMAMESQDDQ